MSDDEFMLMALRGDVDALAFCKAIVTISCVWDDLIDGDKDVPNEKVHEMMHAALIVIPNNRFYRAHADELQPLIQHAIVNWHLSNAMEKVSGVSREIAHVSRYAVVDVIVYAVGLKGGMAWARQHGAEIRMRAQKDRFEDFDREMNLKHGGA